jgi:outer membrane protein TolC
MASGRLGGDLVKSVRTNSSSYLLIALLSTLAGCAVNSPSTVELQQLAPSQWAVSSPVSSVDFQPLQAAQLGKFWAAFGDPVLDRLIHSAALNSPTLEQARARLDEAAAQAGKAKADQWPTVTAELSGAREKTPA